MDSVELMSGPMAELAQSQSAQPQAAGLYDPRNERDSCGIGFVADIKNRKTHTIVRQGLEILRNLTHRGAVGADPLAGDGAGILIQLPEAFLRAEAAAIGIVLPTSGRWGAGNVFLPREPERRAACERTVEEIVRREGLEFLGWRNVPVDNSCLGFTVKPTEPCIRQMFVGCPAGIADADLFERKLYVVRKQIHITLWAKEAPGASRTYIASLSQRTLLYKGMVLAENVPVYYRDLNDPRVESALALVHQRFSTNTFPSWELAQPFRYLCHNGEINTLRGNINWMQARRQSMRSKVLGDDLAKLWPLIGDGMSDSATFDNALELLVAGGYPLAHAMMLMIPEAWNDPLMDEKRRAFYEYHAALMEPWDGPAAIAFTDGRQIGATLDRNGLRPARFLVTDDDMVIMASEMGVLEIPPEKIVRKWRLQPGKMFLIDLEKGRIIDDAELKRDLAEAKPYREWLERTQIKLDVLPAEVAAMPPAPETLLDRQQAFGYTQEDIKFWLGAMAEKGEEPLLSMGRDIPPAVLSERPKLLYDYFKQCFAQVTNPPIDPIREELVMSLVSFIGPRPNLLDLDSGGSHTRLEVKQPILSNGDLEKIRHIHEKVDNAFRTQTIGICWLAEEGAGGMDKALERVCAEARKAVQDGFNIIILSDRAVDADRVAIPALLATAAVHHDLIRHGMRTEVGLVVETGEARQVHDCCLLAGFGAEAINPYLAFETLSALLPQMETPLDEATAHKHYIKAVGKGIMKVMSKMGISTFQSYCGAQIFDAVGLGPDLIGKYFPGTASPLGGVGLAAIAEETVRRHRQAFGNAPIYRKHLDVGGELAYRQRGEEHMWTPEAISLLHHAIRSNDAGKYAAFATVMDEQEGKLRNFRSLLDFHLAAEPLPLEAVESAQSIARRFATGAMSFGSISYEAHTTLAIAMNRLGGRSNTGEGGEEAERYLPLPNGDSRRSAVKQVASGRFGVTTEYLVNADEIQIKMAQGAKPGEGGQLPGHKVDQTIARVRHSTPGVGLISPPPHHDIYSIEDLAQLIHDLKNVNPQARVSVKLVSEVGVGTIASGVSKAHADHVLISGFEGGTGASPITSIMQAGYHWEVGLAETHQTLVAHRLRGRIRVQADGGMRTGRDVVIAALLGADEVGFGTIALITTGCIMMRKCHLNTCPVGVATQDSQLRERFTGKPEDVVNYFMFVAEDVRRWMARLGFRTYDAMIGRADRLRLRDGVEHAKAGQLDFSRLFHRAIPPESNVATYHCETQDHGLDKALDQELIRQATPALENRTPVRISLPVSNINRSLGAMLSGEVARRYGHAGLAEDTIAIAMRGTAGQSFGAWLARGVSLTLEGEANDYVGKGLSGGRIVIMPPRAFRGREAPEKHIIVGNTVLYGAIAGECYFSGVAGERFAVRNSGALAVVEGVGDHGCEYMTGGCVVVLGETGRNFAAGMSGGIAYVYDPDQRFTHRCNTTMVRLSPMRPGAGIPETLDPEEAFRDWLRFDEPRLKRLISQHHRYTASPIAARLLANWEQACGLFVKVLPRDFENALQKNRGPVPQAEAGILAANREA